MIAGRANSSAEARPRSKFDDAALGRATDFCVLQLRPRKEHVSASWVLEPEDKAAISYKVHEPNSACNVPNVITVTPHLAEKANEMTSTNKDSKTLLDRDLDRQSTVLAAVLLMPTEDTARPTDSTVTELSMPT